MKSHSPSYFRRFLVAMVLLVAGVALWPGPRHEADIAMRAATVPSQPIVPRDMPLFRSYGFTEDRYADARALSAPVLNPINLDGRRQRVRMVRQDNNRYPITRVVDTMDENGVLRRQLAMVGDHVMVQLQPGADEATLLSSFAALGGELRKRLPASGVYLISFPHATAETVPQAVAVLEKNGTMLRTVEPDWIVHATRTPDDTRYSELWGMNNAGQTGGTLDADIDAPEAWDFGIGSRSISVGILDTGIDYNHPDLAANIWQNPAELNGQPNVDDDRNGYVDDIRGWDWVNDDNDPMDDNRHGTHCAGTIGASGNNGIGVGGVCWQVSLVGLKFLSAGGSGNTSDATEATAYATRLGLTLTSNSWGGGSYSQALKDMIDGADRAGILFVAAAGNDGVNSDAFPSFPSGYDSANVISVAATDASERLAAFSNFGAGSVDLSAPGVGILSTVPGGGYALLSGTSMAAPHVTGACALLKSFRSSLSPRDIKQLLVETVDRPPTLKDKVFSNGRLNVYQAMVRLTDLLVTPAQPFVASGRQGGTFIPEQKVWQILNNGVNPAPWTAVTSVSWVSITPGSGLLAPGESVTLTAQLTNAVNGLPGGTHRTEILMTNTVSGLVQGRSVEIQAEEPARIPFADGFEGAANAPWWKMSGTGNWRTQIVSSNGPHTGSGHIVMDEALDSGNGARNEATLLLDAAGYENLSLTFWAKGFTDEPDGPPPAPFVRGADFDGVALSIDGTSWYELQGLRQITTAWQSYTVDLSAAMTARGLTAGGILRLRFNHFDNYSVPTDGLAIDDISITAVPVFRLALEIPERSQEGEGTLANRGILRLGRVTENDLMVHLSSTDVTELQVPSAIIVPAGRAQISFDLTVIDDVVADGTRAVRIVASADAYAPADAAMMVDDNERGTLTILGSTSIIEGGGSSLRIALPDALLEPLTVELSVSRAAALKLPPLIVIPAGVSDAYFVISAPDNALLEPPSEVTITACVPGWPSAEKKMALLDNENRRILLTIQPSGRESDGTRGQSGRIRLDGTTPVDLTVALSSSDSSELQVPSSIVIPAGTNGTDFVLTFVDDSLIDGVAQVTVSASVLGFASAKAIVDVYDDESAPAPRDPSPTHLAARTSPFTGLAWQVDDDGATAPTFAIWFGESPDRLVALGETSALTWSLSRLTLDQTYYWQISAKRGFAITSGPVWSFTVPPVGDVVRFAWSAIASPQSVNIPFPYEITAQDEFGNKVSSFNDTTSLSSGSGSVSNLLISEVNPQTPDGIELTNVAGGPIDISGWSVSFFDDNSPFIPITTFIFPSNTMAPTNGVCVVEEGSIAGGAWPRFTTATNLYWTSDQSSRIAILVQDAAGKIVDFACAAKCDPSAISQPFRVPVQQWTGNALVASSDAIRSFQRRGDADTNTPDDWMLAPVGMGTANASLTLPFNSRVEFMPLFTGPFIDGVWKGTLTVAGAAPRVILTATDNAGHSGASSPFEMLSGGPISIRSALSLREGAGNITTAIIVTLPAAVPTATTVSLTSADESEIVIPLPAIVIPSGESVARFDINLPDDDLLDLTQAVALTAQAPGFSTSTFSVDVEDNDSAVITLTSPEQTSESPIGVPLVAVVGLSRAATSPLVIRLTSSRPEELTVPPTVTIPAGMTEIAFVPRPVNDDFIDGPQSVRITAHYGTWLDATADVTVHDDEGRALLFNVPGPLIEGGNAVQVRVIAPGRMVTALIVTLHSSDPSEAMVPEFVTIAAGETSAFFTLTLPDDGLNDGLQNVILSATAAGFVSVIAPLDIQDNDVFRFRLSHVETTIAGGALVPLTVTAEDINGSPILSYIGPASLSASGSIITPTSFGEFRQGTWTGVFRIREPASNVILLVVDRNITGQSNPFTVIAGPKLKLPTTPLEITLRQDTSATLTMRIINEGGTDLAWRIMPILPHAPIEKIRLSADRFAKDLDAILPEHALLPSGIGGNSLRGIPFGGLGNVINTNLGNALPYSDDVIASSMLLNGREYFTRSLPHVWILGADVTDITHLESQGTLAAMTGNVDRNVISTTAAGRTWRGFVKRARPGSPATSLHRLVMIPDNGSATQSVSVNVTSDFQRISSLKGCARLYSLLFSLPDNGYADDAKIQEIMNAYLVRADAWVAPVPDRGMIEPLAGRDLTISVEATGLEVGDLVVPLQIDSSDPDDPTQTILLTIHVISGKPSLTLQGPDVTTFNLIQGRREESRNVATLTNTGNSSVTWSVSTPHSWILLSGGVSGTLQPEATSTFSVGTNSTGLQPGIHTGTVTVVSNDRFVPPLVFWITLQVTAAVHHFDWSLIASPLQIDRPFAVTITARLPDGNVAEYFDESVALRPSNEDIRITPEVSTAFSAGVWNGTVTVHDAMRNLRLRASYVAANARGDSAIFDCLLQGPQLAPEPVLTIGSSNTLTWSRSKESADYEYQIERDNTSAFLTSDASPWLSGQTHTFTGLSPGTKYFYRVRGRSLGSVVWSRAAIDLLTGASAESVTGDETGVMLTPSLRLRETFEKAIDFSHSLFDGPGSHSFLTGPTPAGGLIPAALTALPVAVSGDREAWGLGNALMANTLTNRFTDGMVEAILTRRTDRPVAGGFWLRASALGHQIDGLAIALRYLDATTARIEIWRSIGGNVEFLGLPGSNIVTASDATENFRLCAEMESGRIGIRLWRLSATGEEPVVIENNTVELVRTDMMPRSGIAGLLATGSLSSGIAFDDITITSNIVNDRIGRLLSPVISLADATEVAITWDADPGVTIDVMNGTSVISSQITSGTILGLPLPTELRLRAGLTGSARLRAWSVSQRTSNATQLTLWSGLECSTQHFEPGDPAGLEQLRRVAILEAAPTMSLVRNEAGLESLIFTYHRPEPSTGLDFAIETSDDLDMWVTADSLANTQTVQSSGDRALVTVRLIPQLGETPLKFARLRVTIR